MVIYIAVPRTVGESDEKTEALGELQLLIDAGYSAVSLDDKYTERGHYRVFGMARTVDAVTDLDPSSHAATA